MHLLNIFKIRRGQFRALYTRDAQTVVAGYRSVREAITIFLLLWVVSVVSQLIFWSNPNVASASIALLVWLAYWFVVWLAYWFAVVAWCRWGRLWFPLVTKRRD